MTTTFANKTIAILVLGAALTAQKTLYVDAVNGLPTNSGATPSAALKSITQASAVAAKGDTIVVLPGTYDVAIEGAFPVQFGNTATIQDDITVIAAEGPSKTFIDGGGTYSGIGMIRFRENARGARISGFTFKSMADSFWSCGIRLGSSSGNQFRAWDVEVDNNVFASSLSRAFVIFGAGTASQRQTTGLKIHNNLMLSMNPNRRSCAIYGDGVNYLYNNTIIHPTDTTNRAAIYINALLSRGATASSRAVIYNNIIVGGGSNSWGIEKAAADTTTWAGAATAVVENNNSWNNKSNYQGFTASNTNLSMDPKFVSATDMRLQFTSPLINKGSANVPLIRHDPDGYPARRANPDIGAYESHINSFSVTTQPKIAGNIEFEFKGAGGLGLVFLAFDEGSVFLPGLGQVLIDPSLLLLVGTTSSPGKMRLGVPNDSSLEGLRVVLQGVYQGARSETLNVVHTYIRK